MSPGGKFGTLGLHLHAIAEATDTDTVGLTQDRLTEDDRESGARVSLKRPTTEPSAAKGSMSVETRQTLRRRLFAFLVAGVGSTAAAAISFAMTVYEAANPKPAPIVAPGQPIDTGRWIVTLREARTGSIPPTGIKPFAPKNLVMVEFDLDNRSASASNALLRLLAIDPPVTNLPPPVFYLVRDKWIASSLQPNMPERMIAAWDWPSNTPLPQQLRLKIGSQIHKRRDNLYGAPGWFDRDPAAIVVLAVSSEAPGAGP